MYYFGLIVSIFIAYIFGSFVTYYLNVKPLNEKIETVTEEELSILDSCFDELVMLNDGVEKDYIRKLLEEKRDSVV